MGYLSALAALLPPGMALSPAAPEVSRLLKKTATELEVVEQLDQSLFDEMDPRQAQMLLTEYEHSLNLPDRCSIGAQSMAERQAAVYNKLTDGGGARRSRYLAILSALGQPDADIERFKLHTCESDCDTAVFDQVEWLFTWSVTLHNATTVIESTCISHCEEPLSVWGNTQIECVLDREKQAHTHIIFKYRT